ncbi:hypothetical protein DCS_05494 [Drechmeria coniospora]|uniref:Zn(2)-C6 fungal-type domain-containing protein n=1 Tax=Drechmeria coniospora TaxID=98403 RepID=A0A151GN26_DRECN|nr:hypothetical protein DCS_05494 [Drechmeria coniospora]KYK58478.1 hypothetical protein DCS_05494 [Drechmeria coniospora]ODA83875.1 hypothetical protein RJ55_02391 [Drechmeria coniospora]
MSSVHPSAPAPAPAPAPVPVLHAHASTAKRRSCVTCRARKVRCDKSSPCSNCRRANIACVVPSTDRPPRWARRLDRITGRSHDATQQPDAPAVGQVMERLRTLEGLVQELGAQLQQARAHSSAPSPAPAHSDRPPRASGSPPQATGSAAAGPQLQSQLGRLVVADSGQSRYVSSSFWSRVHDELDGLKMDTEGIAGGDYDSSDDDDDDDDDVPVETPSTSTRERDRTPSDRHAFVFGHNLTSPPPDSSQFHPLPSQIPFLLQVFSENVNSCARVVHVPTVHRMIRDLRSGDLTSLTPAEDSLLFAMYYAAVASMEEDDVATNFGNSKSDLLRKYRLGLEHALARADFLNAPDLTLVQAFAIFLILNRRHDSPRFVWMMTGLVIRMAQALGLHRDGRHFPHLTPFQVEMRRRVWWAVCMLDARASEDQGTDLTLPFASFDTRMPLNINDDDIGPDTEEMPEERVGMTDMTPTLLWCKLDDLARQIMTVNPKDGPPSLDDQSRLLNEYYERLDRTYLQYSDASGNSAYWMIVTVVRLVVAKMTLIIYLPKLLSEPSDSFSDEIRTKLFVAAIEVAEYNDALNSERACRQWRWIFQTYTHWHAIVYLLLVISRRSWSPTVERAWAALHSAWLIPDRSNADKNLRVWLPLRTLMLRARRHRHAEIQRLRSDAQAVARLEAEDRHIPQPASTDPLAGAGADSFRERWRKLVTMPSPLAESETAITHEARTIGDDDILPHRPDVLVPQASSLLAHERPGLSARNGSLAPDAETRSHPQLDPGMTADAPTQAVWEQPTATTNMYTSAYGADPPSVGMGFGAWLWADMNPSLDIFAPMESKTVDTDMDIDGDIDWNSWVESARGIEWSAE